MPVVLKCHHCSHEKRMLDVQMLDVLQTRGMLRRAKEPDLTLVRELLTSIGGELKCNSCHEIGVAIMDDWSDDWSDEVQCLGCKTAIDPERLEVFPDTKYCPKCQKLVDAGGSPGAEDEYCERCGGIMKLSRRGGSGTAGYVMSCTDCGKRA